MASTREKEIENKSGGGDYISWGSGMRKDSGKEREKKRKRGSELLYSIVLTRDPATPLCHTLYHFYQQFLYNKNHLIWKKIFQVKQLFLIVLE